jgi:hypothetical protein
MKATSCQFNRLRLIVAIHILALGCFAPAAMADGLTSATAVGTNGGNSNLCSQSDSSTTLATSSCSATWQTTGDQGLGISQSHAAFGELGAFTGVTTVATPAGFSSAFTAGVAQATWGDNLTFTNLDGPASLEIFISLTGLSTGASLCTITPDTTACGFTSVEYYTELNNGNSVIDCILTAVGFCETSVAITGASQVDFSGFLSVGASANITGQDPNATVKASADFLDTGKVDSLLIVDGNGNPIQGAGIVSASGTDYNNLAEPPVSTPEPSGLLLLGSGLLAVIGAGKARLSSRHV